MDTASLRLRETYVPFPKPVHDLPAVEVHDNNIEKAIRTLKKTMLTAGVLRRLKARGMNPAPAARARRKAIEAASRRKREQARKAKR